MCLVTCQKNSDPNLASPSNAKIYLKTRERKPGRNYKANVDVVQNRIDGINEMIRQEKDAEVMLSIDKSHGPDWLVRRQGKSVGSTVTPSAPTIPEPYIEELTAKITRNIESAIKAKVNRKVQENMAWRLKKLGEANQDMKIDIGDLCATPSSDQDDDETPFTQDKTPYIQGGAATS